MAFETVGNDVVAATTRDAVAVPRNERRDNDDKVVCISLVEGDDT